MVQMKDYCRDGSEIIPELYIPHGSDERYLLSLDVKSSKRLYIPHGSDESITQMFLSRPLPSLYPTWFR